MGRRMLFQQIMLKEKRMEARNQKPIGSVHQNVDSRERGWNFSEDNRGLRF
jgi:hypothetical protein